MVYLKDKYLWSEINTEKIRWLLTLCMVLAFVFNVIFLPADNFGIKKLSFAIMLLLNADKIVDLETQGQKFAGLFGVGLTTYCICKSVLLNGDIVGNVSFGFAGYMLLTYVVTEKNRIPLLKITMAMLAVLALFIAVSGVLDITGVFSVYSNRLLMWMYYNSNALVGSAAELPIGITVFLFTSPLLLIAIPWYAENHLWIAVAVSAMAVVFSGTRANILVGVTVVLASIVLTSKNPGVKYLICIAGTLLVIYVFYRYNVLGLIERMFEKKVESDSIRSIEMQSLIQVWKDDPIRLITGQGFSATFYNAVTQTNEVAVEWSYVNLLRQIGLIPFTLMMIMFLKPIETAIRNKRNYSVVVGYLGYLAVAATNPLLYTSTGMLALLLMTYVAYDYVEGEEWHRKLT